MPKSFEEWKESVDDDMDVAGSQMEHGCCIEVCQQMVTLNGQVIELAGTSMTSDEKQKRKEDFKKKFEFLEKRCEEHLNGLSDSMREAQKKELAGAKKTFDTSIKFLD
jgi:hypothetical protein